MNRGTDSDGPSAAGRAAAMRPDRNVIARRVDDGTILIHLRTNRIYELNATGTRIWELLRAGYNLAGIRAHLHLEFDVDEADLTGAIEDTLELLLRENLIDSGSTH